MAADLIAKLGETFQRLSRQRPGDDISSHDDQIRLHLFELL